MGLKDMFRSGSKQTLQSHGSPQQSPQSSRAGSIDGKSERSNACRKEFGTFPPNENINSAQGMPRIVELEKELAQSRQEEKRMRDEVAELEKKIEALCASYTAYREKAEAPDDEERGQRQKAADEKHQRAEMELREKADYEKRAKEALEALNHAKEALNKQLSGQVRDLQNELQRVREGEQSKSSFTESDEHPQKSTLNRGPLEDVNEKTMGTRIEELEEQLQESQEDLQAALMERDELQHALQDAENRLSTFEASGAENNMHDIFETKLKDVERQLVETQEKLKRTEETACADSDRLKDVQRQLDETQVQLKRAEMTAKVAEHAFEELLRRRELENKATRKEEQERQTQRERDEKLKSGQHDSLNFLVATPREPPQGPPKSTPRTREIEEAGATSDDPITDLEDDSEGEGKSQLSERSSPENSPKLGDISPSPQATMYKRLERKNFKSKERIIQISAREEGWKVSKEHVSEDPNIQALEAERCKNKVLEMKLSAVEERMLNLEKTMKQHQTGLQKSTEKWVEKQQRRKIEPDERMREEIEEQNFQQKVEDAKKLLSRQGVPLVSKPMKVPDLGKAYPWEKSPGPAKREKKGVSIERPTSPSQRKHFHGHLRSKVTHDNAGITFDLKNPKEAAIFFQPLKTDRTWNQTQVQGTKYGFTPNENTTEMPPPRVTLIAPDKVTGQGRAPWLVECHPEYDEKELKDQGIGRSKKLFAGQGFHEGIMWPEHKEEVPKTYDQRQSIMAHRGHYKGKPEIVPDAAGCPSSTPSGANIKINREQYGDHPGKGEWYDSGSKAR